MHDWSFQQPVSWVRRGLLTISGPQIEATLNTLIKSTPDKALVKSSSILGSILFAGGVKFLLSKLHVRRYD
jgi:hypothetical protein